MKDERKIEINEQNTSGACQEMLAELWKTGVLKDLRLQVLVLLSLQVIFHKSYACIYFVSCKQKLVNVVITDSSHFSAHTIS